MNDDASIAAPRCSAAPAVGGASPAAWPREPRLACPLGRVTRLIPVARSEGLVECRPAEAGHCPKFMSFGGGFFCRAHLEAAGGNGFRQP